MDNNKIVLPYVDGIPTDANQVRISWFVNGEPITGSGNRFRAEGSLNKLHFQLYQNINTIKNSVNSFYDVYEDIQDEFKDLKETVLEFDDSIKELQESSELTLVSVQGLIDVTHEHASEIESIKEDIETNESEYEVIKVQIQALEEKDEVHDLKFEEYYTKEETDITMSYYYNGEKIDDLLSSYYDSGQVDTLNSYNLTIEAHDTYMLDYYTIGDVDQKFADFTLRENDFLDISSRFYTKTVMDETLELYSTIEDVNQKFTDFTLSDPHFYQIAEKFYKKEEIDGKLELYSLVSETYNKNEIDSKLEDNASKEDIDIAVKEYTYSKAEVGTLLDSKGTVVQGLGTSTVDVMSQKTTTDELNKRITGGSVQQGVGTSTVNVMSQKATTDELNTKADNSTVVSLSSKVDGMTSSLSIVEGGVTDLREEHVTTNETLVLLQGTITALEERIALLESQTSKEGE